MAASAVYAVLALVLFGQGLLPGRLPTGSDYLWQSAPWTTSVPAGVSGLGSNFEVSDSVVQFQPFLLETREAWPDAPLWNPHLMGGRPFLANAQSAVFSPFNLPAYLLPFWHSLALIQMLKILVAALGAFVFGRSLGMRFPGALTAGTVFGLSQAMVYWSSWPHTSTWALLPWLLFLVDRVVRRPSVPSSTAAAVVVALAYLGGHPETSFDVLAAGVAWFAFRVLQHERAWERIRSRLLAFGLALVAGTALAAIMLIPFVELLLSSWDYDARADLEARALGARYLPAFFMPDWWGRPTQAVIEPYVTLPIYGHAFYAGALSLLLAVVALVTRRSAERTAFAAVALVAVLMVAGAEPLFGIVSELRGPAKMDKLFFYAVFSVAVLAGFGLDDLVDGALTGRRRPLVGGAVVIAIPVVWAIADGAVSFEHFGSALGAAVGLGAGEPAHPADAREAAEIRMGAVLLWLVLAGVGYALIRWRLHGRLRGSLFAAAALGLIVLDLLKVGIGFNPAVPSNHAVQPPTPALQYLQARQPSRFVGLDGPSLFGLPALAPNLAMRHGLYDARGYDFPAERRFARLWSDNVSRVVPEPRFSFREPTPRALRALGLLSVSNVLQDVRQPPLDVPGLSLVYEGWDARVYQNEHALPRAFLASAQTVMRGDAAAREVASPHFDARNVVLTEEPVDGLPRARENRAAAPGPTRLEEYEAERVTVTTRTPRPAMLVLTDTYFPGWVAEVDGEPAELHRVDYLLRGVVLPPGRHRVEFAYRPASWRIGWIVSLVAAVGLLAALAYSRFRR